MRSFDWKWVLFAVLVFAGQGVAVAAEGNDSLKAEVESLQRRLEQQEDELARMRAQQQELLEKLKQQQAAETAAVSEAVPGAEAEETSPPQATQTSGPPEPPWWRGERLHLGGYGSFRFETNDVGGDQFVPGSAATGFTFRRFVLTTDSRLNDRLHVYSEIEFERLLEIETEKRATRKAGGVTFAQEVEGNSGAEVSLEQLWLEYDLGESQAIRAGVVLPPLGRFNILHDDDYWDLPRRTLVDRDAPVVPVPVAWRELGAGWVGSLAVGATGKLDYQFYVLNGATLDFNLEHVAQTRAGDTSKQALEAELGLSSGAVDGTKNAEAVSWRVAYSPTLAGEVAVSGYHGQYTPSFLAVDEPVNALGLDGKWRLGQFEVEGEAVYSSFGNTEAVGRSLAAAALRSESEAEVGDLESEAEIELNGLARRRFGFWTDLKYHWRPAFLRQSFLGRKFEDPQLIPIVRYERVWVRGNIEELEFTDGLVTDLEMANLQQDRLTLGLNYRPVQQVGFQFAYEHNQRRTGERLIFPAVAGDSTNGFLMGMTFGF
jgi:hypothetical protein